MVNAESDEEHYSHRPKEGVDKQVGRTVFQSVKSTIERISFLCTYRMPAKVGASFDGESLKLSIDWPFSLACASGEPGIWPASQREVDLLFKDSWRT